MPGETVTANRDVVRESPTVCPDLHCSFLTTWEISILNLDRDVVLRVCEQRYRHFALAASAPRRSWGSVWKRDWRAIHDRARWEIIGWPAG